MLRRLTKVGIARPSTILSTKLGDMVLARRVDGTAYRGRIKGKSEHEPGKDPQGKDGASYEELPRTVSRQTTKSAQIPRQIP